MIMQVILTILTKSLVNLNVKNYYASKFADDETAQAIGYFIPLKENLNEILL